MPNKKNFYKTITIDIIERRQYDKFIKIPESNYKKQDTYPWESKHVGKNLKITKEFFRCKGSVLNPPIKVCKLNNLTYHRDCGGIEQHSLPIRNGEEFVYPIMITMLNLAQKIMESSVVITCGHRCPAHNLYSDRSKMANSSKHLICAEVDFYVEGFEYDPMNVVNIFLQNLQGPFKRSKGFSSSSIPSWYNKEVVITIYPEGEGRDFDNDHPYPYISITVLYDYESNSKVNFNWEKARNGFFKTGHL